jgi:hypothetical protein
VVAGPVKQESVHGVRPALISSGVGDVWLDAEAKRPAGQTPAFASARRESRAR